MSSEKYLHNLNLMLTKCFLKVQTKGGSANDF